MPDTIHSYVDEAGDPTLFGRKRGSSVIVGNEGCSKFFIMGKLEVSELDSLSEKLTRLRHDISREKTAHSRNRFSPKPRGEKEKATDIGARMHSRHEAGFHP